MIRSVVESVGYVPPKMRFSPKSLTTLGQKMRYLRKISLLKDLLKVDLTSDVANPALPKLILGHLLEFWTHCAHPEGGFLPGGYTQKNVFFR